MSEKQLKTIRKATWIGSIANIVLAIVKITVGKLTGSQALIADGVHSFSDLVTDAAILIGAKYWSAPPDKEHPYGHGRFETLTNIFIGFLLALVGIGIGWEAIHSLGQAPEKPAGILALIVALLSIAVKESLYRWTLTQAKQVKSRALHANAWHHRSDALSSLPVVIAVAIGAIFPHIHYLDQLAACIVMVMILKAAFDILWPAILELTDVEADQAIDNKIQEYASNNPQIKEVHAIRNRRTGSSILVDFHLLVDRTMNVEEAHTISENFKRYILEHMDEVTDVIIHIEPYTCAERIINPCTTGQCE